MKHGFLLIDKPVGPSSHDVVRDVRKSLSERKIGHLGTLDPAASGLLILAVGAKALKVVEFFGELSKEYLAEVTFGKISSTYDREGVVEDLKPKAGWKIPDEITVRNTITDHFMGKISQVPPAHSAVHVGGERAYRKARQGRGVNVPPRDVRITECKIERYKYPKLTLKVACSSGTYIRSLAHDLGQHRRCGGYLSALKRTKVGEWSLDFAIPPEEVDWSFIVPLKEVLTSFPSVDVSADEAEDIRHGRNINKQVKPDTFAWFEDLPIAVLTPAKDGSKQAHARKVL